MAQYIGVYQLNPEVEIKVSTESGRLVALGPDNTKLVLHAETEKDFYLPGQYLFAHFQKDEAGKITGFQLEQFSGEVLVKKVK
ncbi:hypothetical protein L0337_32030 [candidate division KSB1 bacterium]|nr:hypothetical protein [candidate division KSB1 bacterium]